MPGPQFKRHMLRAHDIALAEVALAELSPFQAQLIAALRKCANSTESTTRLAARLNSSRPAVVSAGRALERKGLLCSFRSDNSQWAALKWALTRKAHNMENEKC